MITLYSTGCPKCKVLETKLNNKNIEFNVNTDVDEMLQ
jgi:glutaredoxin